MPMKNPPHPGEFIRTEILEPAGLSVTAAAAVLHVSRPALSSLLNGKADLSGDMALRLEKAFGVKMDMLMRMQSSYNIAQTRKRAKGVGVRRSPQQSPRNHRTTLKTSLLQASSDEGVPFRPAATELPILHLGTMGALHRRDIYDDVR